MKPESWKVLVSAAIPYYLFNEGGKPYHGYAHALEVMDNVIFLNDSTGKTRDSLLLAAIWHDAIYTPGSRDGLNEEASAAAFDYEWKRMEIDEPASLLNDTKWLIEGTRVSNHLVREDYFDADHATLLDADLGSLAMPYDIFVQNQANIFKENSGDPKNAGHVNRQKVFLSQFLTVRKSIYHTAIARKLWEPIARENIERFVKSQRNTI